MSKEIQIDEELKKKFEDLVLDEVKYGIMTALEMYDSLNLKKLAQLVGRPETTTIRYVKALLSDGFIDIDAEKTASSWGKFYRLSAQSLYITEKKREMTEEVEKAKVEELFEYKEKSEEEVRSMIIRQILGKGDFNKLMLEVKNSMIFKHNVENTIINEFIASLNELENLKKKFGNEYLYDHLRIHPSDIILTSTSIKFAKAKHLLKIYEIFIRFMMDLEKLKSDLDKEIKEEKIPEEDISIMNIHTFFGTNEFRFSLEDKE
ncbi:MAG: hypothetical protein ACFFDW_02155 [Candidatus Thorarchaeota archaeon]